MAEVKVFWGRGVVYVGVIGDIIDVLFRFSLLVGVSFFSSCKCLLFLVYSYIFFWSIVFG